MMKAKGLLRIFALGLPLLLLGAGPVTLDPNRLNREGAEADSRGDYARAVELFREAYNIEPTQPALKNNLFNALNNLAIKSAQSDDITTAIKACSEALDLAPEDVRVASNLSVFYHNRAVDMAKKKDFTAARDAIENSQRVIDRFNLRNIAANVRETHARVYLLEAREKFIKNEVSEALDLIGRCIEINPDEAIAYLDRARVHYEQQFYADAISDLELALEILGENKPIKTLLDRLGMEAETKGLPRSEEETYFVIESPGATMQQEQTLQRLLKDMRLKVARNLVLNPKTPITITVQWQSPLKSIAEWSSNPANQALPNKITIGAADLDLLSEEFRKCLQFHYVASLILNVAGEGAPYWFVTGLAEYQAEGTCRLTPEETEQIISAGENYLLFRLEDLTPEKLRQVEDPSQLRIARLQMKGICNHLIETVRMNGIRQIMKSLAGGVPFEQALKDNVNISSEVINKEWQTSLGLKTEG